jgi:FAD/FMN-containing dehydrogenase
MMYSRSGLYAQKLRDLKKELDPNNILNPGRLCF